MKSKTLLLASLLVFLLLPEAQGYKLSGYKWTPPAYNYYINGSNHDVAASSAILMVRNGANAWKTWCPGTYKGTTTLKQVANNGMSTVFFRNVTNGSTLATTYVFYETLSGKTLEFDMVFWDAHIRFFVGNSGCNEGFYLQDIATHEFGHVLGLSHSNVQGATMNPTTPYCNLSWRSLALDDKNGAGALY